MNLLLLKEVVGGLAANLKTTLEWASQDAANVGSSFDLSHKLDGYKMSVVRKSWTES